MPNSHNTAPTDLQRAAAALAVAAERCHEYSDIDAAAKRYIAAYADAVIPGEQTEADEQDFVQDFWADDLRVALMDGREAEDRLIASRFADVEDLILTAQAYYGAVQRITALVAPE